MKVFGVIAKIIAALAAVAGVVYLVATYGDKIVAWAKGLLSKCPCCCGDEECCCGDEECCCEEAAEEKCCCCEEAAEEAPAADEVQAEDSEFVN